MSWKSFACLAALGAMSAPAVAQPSIEIIDNGGGNATVNVITDATGALGAEIGITLGAGLTLVDATVNTTNFDTANPGDNPFINGLDNPLGGDTTGIATDLGAGTIFASYGSGDLGIGTFELLSFNYTGTGDATAEGPVAQGGALGSVLMDVEALGGGGGVFGDLNGDGFVDDTDLASLLANFGGTGLGDITPPPGVDDADLAGLLAAWNPPPAATAVPEPTSVAMLLSLAAASLIRKRS